MTRLWRPTLAPIGYPAAGCVHRAMSAWGTATAAAPGPIFGVAYVPPPGAAQATDPVTKGGFEGTHRRMAAPDAAGGRSRGRGLTLDPYYAWSRDRRPSPGAVGGVGFGQRLTRVDAPARFWSPGATPIVELEAGGRGRGGGDLTNDSLGNVGNLPVDTGTIPTLSITRDEGEQLRQRLATSRCGCGCPAPPGRRTVQPGVAGGAGRRGPDLPRHSGAVGADDVTYPRTPAT